MQRVALLVGATIATAQLGRPVALGPLTVTRPAGDGGLDGLAPAVNAANVVGRPRPLDPSSTMVQEAATRAVGAFNAAQTTDTRYDLLRIVGGTQQVVSGVKYALTLEVAPTGCGREEPLDSGAACPFTAGNEGGAPVGAHTFAATVWARPWLQDAGQRFQVTLPHGTGLEPHQQEPSESESRLVVDPMEPTPQSDHNGEDDAGEVAPLEGSAQQTEPVVVMGGQ